MAFPVPGAKPMPPQATVSAQPQMAPPHAAAASPLMAMLAALAAHLRRPQPGAAGGPPAQGMRQPMQAMQAPPPAGAMR